MNNTIKITEHGAPAHFICADRCTFHRHTLLRNKTGRAIIVSTVGKMQDIHAPGWPNTIKYATIGCQRYYETMIFVAQKCNKCDPPCGMFVINVNKTRSLPCHWSLSICDNTTDARADSMHDANVNYVKQNFNEVYSDTSHDNCD